MRQGDKKTLAFEYEFSFKIRFVLSNLCSYIVIDVQPNVKKCCLARGRSRIVYVYSLKKPGPISSIKKKTF